MSLRSAVVAAALLPLLLAGGAFGQFFLDQSQQSKSRHIEPVTQPFFFESPYIESNVRPILIWNSFPKNSAAEGGDLRVYALQTRLQVDERTALVLTKSGYAIVDPDAGSKGRSWIDVAGGIKYAFVNQDDVTFTGGIIYESTSGSRRVYQGNGKGVVRPILGLGFALDQAVNFVGTVGYNYTLDDEEEPQSFDYHLHLSYQVTPTFIPLVELNGIRYLNGAKVVDSDSELLDYGNVGATDVKNQNVVTAAIGARFLITNAISFGAAYEAPISNHKDIMAERLTFDVVVRF